MGLRLVDPGNTIFAGNSNALAVVTQLQRDYRCLQRSPKTTSPRVRSQNSAAAPALPVDAFDRSQLNKIATGHLLTIDNAVDTTTGTIRFLRPSLTIKISRSALPQRLRELPACW